MKSRLFRQINRVRWIPSSQGHPYWNMAVDEAIAKEVSSDQSPPTLRFYTWNQPSVSIGYFQNPVEDLDLSVLNERNIPWVRRITGGKGIFHHLELTYSFSAPLSLSISILPHDIRGSYQKLGFGFAKGLHKLDIPVQLHSVPPNMTDESIHSNGRKGNPLCFSSPSWYESLIQGKKVIGSAQKRFKKGFLQQGTILLRHRFEDFHRIFRLPSDVIPDFIGIFDFLKKEIPVANLEQSLVDGLENELGITFLKGHLTENELKLAQELSEKKYGCESWNSSRSSRF